MFEQFSFIIFLIFIVFAGIRFLYYILFLGRLVIYKDKAEIPESLPGVSVVICARNEYLNLEKFLPKVLEQDYPNFEVVVVNDRSEDDSIFLLNQLKQKYAHLSVIDFKQELNFFKGKKFPLSVGIKSAKHDIVLLTDADCYPSSDSWILHMASKFDDQTDIVLGYGAYKRTKGLLNHVIRFDAYRIASLYLSSALWKQAYMGIGRNLAYRKSLFYEQNGFSSHYKIPSGDDDLFINKASNKNNTRITFIKDSHTISNPKEKWSQWWNQKSRHLSTAKHYKFKHQILLFGWEMSSYLTIGFLFICILIPYSILYTLSVYSLILIIKLIINGQLMKSLGERKLLLSSMFTEFLLAIIYPIIGFLNLFHKEKKWK